MRKLTLPCMLVFTVMTTTAAQLSTNMSNDTIVSEESKIPTIEFVEIQIEEDDEAFDFKTEAYLPIGFDANRSLQYEVVLEEEDVSFDFNMEEYLPVGFNSSQDIIRLIK